MIRTGIAFILSAAATASVLTAAEVKVDLRKTAPTTPLQYRIEPGTFSLTLVNMVPGKEYDLGDESVLSTKEVPTAFATPAPCSEPLHRAEAALRDRKTEEEISKVGSAAVIAECSKSEQEAIVKELPAFTTKTAGAVYSLKAGGSFDRIIKRADSIWKVSVRPQGEADHEAVTRDNLDTQKQRTNDQPSLIVMNCSYSKEECETNAIYLNADQISTIAFSGIPTAKILTVRATGGEYFPCYALRHNEVKFAQSPDKLTVSLFMKRGPFGLLGSRMAALEDEARLLYGVKNCPGEADPGKAEQGTADALAIGQSAVKDTRESTERQVGDLPLLLRGKSEVVQVEFDSGIIIRRLSRFRFAISVSGWTQEGSSFSRGT